MICLEDKKNIYRCAAQDYPMYNKELPVSHQHIHTNTRTDRSNKNVCEFAPDVFVTSEIVNQQQQQQQRRTLIQVSIIKPKPNLISKRLPFSFNIK